MNILIPMAGRGQRFTKVGYDIPKPLIKIGSRSMLEHAINTLDFEGRYIFIVRDYNVPEYDNEVEAILKYIKPDCIIEKIDYVTEGPASSALIASEYINNDQELVIANCDQIMWWQGLRFIEHARNNNFDGSVVTYTSDTPKNSYVKINLNGDVTEVAEKKVISNISLNGIHYWRKGRYFIDSARDMIKADDRVNNEFYIAPTYNYMIKDQKKIGFYHIPNEQHNAVGVPSDLETFINKAKENGYL